MKEKIEKKNIIKTRSEKGAITLFVLLACLFFVFTLTGVYISNVNRLKSQEQNIKQIQENYKRELDNIDEIYEEITAGGIDLSLTAEPEGWTTKVTLKGTGEVEEGKDIEIVEYTFTKDKDMPLSSDWKSAEESEKTKIEKTEEVTENGKYIFWVKDKEGNIYKSNEINITNIDTTPPTAGSIIAKKDTVDGEEYVFEKWTDTDVYVEKVDGTDGESGHKSTTITVQKNGITMDEYTNVEGPITLTENGTYTITVTTEDNAGNKATSEPYIVKIDKVIPVLALKHNDENGEEYEQGTWTKDNLYGEITIDTSDNGKTVEKYQYSYNGITWNDIPSQIGIDYKTTFPMSGDKPTWINDPVKGNEYYFEVDEETNSLKPNNKGIHNSSAISYFEIDLTEYPDTELEITLNVTISCETNYSDCGIASILNEQMEGLENFIYVCGETSTDDYTVTINGGEKYYLGIGYLKDDMDEEPYEDTFTINSITLKSDDIGNGIKFNNYTKVDNKITFTLNKDLDEDIYIRAVYNSIENDTSRYTGKQSIKIDKKAPIIESAEPVITSKTDSKVDVKVVEEGSGLKGYYISTEDVVPTEQSTWTEQILKEFTIEGLKTETTYYLWTIDNVENISEKQEIIIGSVNYLIDGKIATETLWEAISVATDGSTIQLLCDYTDTGTAIFSKNITFDVQSYTLTRKSTITISGGKTVEITGTGKITSGSSSIKTITNNGTLTLSNSITIENSSKSSSNTPIYTNNSSSITNINDNVKIIGYYRGIYNYSGTVNVNGGYIEATYQNSSGYGIYNYNVLSKAYINGGEIRGYYGICNDSYAILEMTGGKVVGTGAYGIAGYGTINIYGGRIEGKTYGLYSNGSNKITFGRQEDELSTTIPTVYGATYGIYLSSETYSFNFYNGKIISNTKETAYRGQANLRTEHMPYTYFDYDVEQRYCTILTPTVENIIMEANPTEYTNGSVKVKITYPYNSNTKQYSENETEWIDVEKNIQEIFVTENKTIYARTINESGMVTDENQIVINNIDKEKPIVTVTPTQTNYTVTETNGTVDLNISITAQDTGVSGLNVMQYAWAKEGEEPTYTDFTNTATINKTKLEIGQYNLYVNVTDKAGNKADLVQMRYNVKYQEPVAQIGSTKYTTVQSAVNACSKSAGNTQTTIIMLKSTDEEFTTYEGQNIKLDLKGYTIGSSSTETPICTNNGTLQIVDTSTNKTGKLESLNGTAIQNNGTITIGDNSTSIENDVPTIYGYKIGIENNNTFNFYDGKIQGITPIKGKVTDTPAEYGPVSTDYDNGITTIRLGIVSGYEARIDWVYYTTVQEAVNATTIHKDGTRDTVTIIKDIQLKDVLNIDINKDMILDLDRYILTITLEKETLIKNNGKLEITDNSIEQTGEITINSSQNGNSSYDKISTIAINNNLGQLIISGGNISCTTTGAYNSSYGIYNNSTGTVKVTDGTVSVISSNKGSNVYGICNSGIGTVEVIGGIVSCSSSNYNYAYGIYNDSAGTIKVPEGTVNSSSNYYSYGIYNNSTGTVEVRGGTVSSSSDSNYAYGIYNKEDGTVKVTGGTVSIGNSTYAAYGIYNDSMGTVEVTGGTLSIISSSYAAYGIYNKEDGTVKVTGGTINCSTSSASGSNYTACGIYNNSAGTVEITGGAVSGNGNNNYAYGIYNNSTGTVEVTGGTVSGSGNNNFAYGIYNDSTGTVTIGIKENGLVSQKDPWIIGKYNGTSTNYVGYGIYNGYGKLEFYNGMIQGNIALIGFTTQIREGYIIENNTINEIESIYLVEKKNTEYVVQINETKYYSLQEAIEDIGEEEKIVQVLRDFELDETIKFNKNITLDLNGYIITNNYYEISNIANLTIIDTTESKKGKIESIETIIGIKNSDNGNLIIASGAVSSSSRYNSVYGIYNYKTGTVRVAGGVVSSSSNISTSNNSAYGIYNNSTGTVEVTGGTVSSSCKRGAYGIYNYDTGIVSITEGTVTSSSSSYSAYGIYNYDTGIIEVTGGTVSSSSSSSSVSYAAYGIYNNSTGTVEVIGGTVSSSSSSSANGIYNNTTGIVEVTGGIVSSSSRGNAYGIRNRYSGTVIIGTKEDGLVSQENPLIEGKYNGTSTNYVGYGIYNTNGNFYFYDGKIQGTTKAVFDTITEREENTELNYNEDETILTLTTELIDIAQIGDVTYKTLQEAINAVGTEQTTIKILRNAAFTINEAKIIIPTSKNIILDLNGYKITSAIEETLIQNEGTLEIIDSTEEKKGALISNTERTLTNTEGAALIVSNGIIENRLQMVVYNEGNVIIQGGIVSSSGADYGIYNSGTGTVEVTGGTVSTIDNSKPAYGIYNNSTGTVEVTGGTVSSSSKYNSVYGIYNNSTGIVKIIEGTVSGSCSWSYSAYGIYNNSTGTVEVTGGTVSTNSTGTSEAAYGIYNSSTGTVMVIEGIVSSTSSIAAYGIYNSSTGTVIIGKKGDGQISQEEPLIKAKKMSTSSANYVVYGVYNPNGTLDYYDGKIQGTDKAIYGKIDEIEGLTELVVTTENEDTYTYNTLTLEQKTTNAVVMNGTEYDSLSKAIKASGEIQNIIKLLRDVGPGVDAIIESNQNIIIDLNGYALSNYNEITNNGTLKIIDTSTSKTGKIIGVAGIAVSNTGTMELNSGTIADSTYGIKNTGTLNIIGGKIENNAYGIYNDTNGNVTITSGEITSNTYGIYNYAGSATTNINGGTISSNEYGVYNYNGTTKITSSGITNNTTYGIYNSGGTTNIKEGSQVQSQTGIYVANGTLNIGEKGTMNPDSPIIIGENFGLEVSVTGVVYMYDGQIKGKQGATQGFITYTETGYTVSNKVEGEYFVDYLALAGTISTVAEVNGVSFSNLQSAINSVVGEKPQTVKLTNGIISTMTFNIAEGQNIILDMNGKTISSDLDVTMNNAGTLVIIDSSSSGVAKLSSTVGTAINNTGTLILGQDDGTVSQDAITIEGQTYGITTSGTLSFYDGTINGASAVNGTVTNRPSGYVIRTTTVNGKERYYLSV